MKKLLITFIVLLWGLWAEETQTNKIKVEVSGLVCEFCAKGLERSFKNIVKNITVSLRKGLVILELFEQGDITDLKIIQLINDNGISVDSIIRNF